MEAVLQTNTITAEINISLALAEAKKKIEEYQLFSKLGDECAQGWKDISDLVAEVKTQLPDLHDIKKTTRTPFTNRKMPNMPYGPPKDH